MPTEIITPKNKPLMSPAISLANELKPDEFQSVSNTSRYQLNNTNAISYEDRHTGNPDSNPQIISLSMYNPQAIGANKNIMNQFSDKNMKIEPMVGGLNDKRDDDYDVNEEGELFPLLTKEKIIEIKRFEQEIKTKSDDDKTNLAINSLKIKRHPVSL